mgnify:CR=1 FL=1
MVELRGSDLHIKSGATPKIRIDGRITELTREILSPQAVNGILKDLLTDEDLKIFERDREVDIIFQVRNLGRFRVNVYQQMMGYAIAIRHIRMDIPTFEELNLPPVLYSLIAQPRGLILVTGATGAGKSTTLAAMIETLNRTSSLNIITIENPIEFAFKEKRCSIQQREIGRDTPSWSEALRRIMRQDPDVIMLGEIRDQETMTTALTAANTGHLVLATLHTMDATQTVQRVASFTTPELASQVRYLLASTLIGVVSQRLLPLIPGPGRIPAVEILVATDTIRQMIIDPEETLRIKQAIEEGSGQYGMQSFDQSLMKLFRSGVISEEEALKYSTSPTDFRIRMRGLKDDQGGIPDWIDVEPSETESKG